MTCYLILNLWGGDWESQWNEIGMRYQAVADQIQHTQVVLLCRIREKIPEILCTELAWADTIWLLEDSFYNPENLLRELVKISQKDAIYLFGYGSYSHEMAVRLAWRLKGSSLTSVRDVFFENGCIYGKKSIYSNNMEGTFRMEQGPVCLSLTKEGARGKEHLKTGRQGEKRVFCQTPKVRRVTATDKNGPVISYSEAWEESGDSLEEAEVLLVFGKGVKSKEDYKAAGELAHMLGAKIGASRPLVMQGIAPLNSLIGTSGAITHPRLCIAAGVSGAAAFYAGIEKSEYIIAINTDPEAFIMSRADVAIEGDYREVFHALKQYLLERGAD